MYTLTEALKLCKIKCYWCLDRKHIIREFKTPFYYIGLEYRYRIYTCPHCTKHEYIRGTNNPIEYINGEQILRGDESSDELVEQLSKKIENAELAIEKKKDKIYELMNDGSIVPKYSKNISNNYTKSVGMTTIHIEFNNMLKNIINMIINKNLQIPIDDNDFTIDLTFSKEASSKIETRCYSGTDENGWPTYLDLKIIINKEKEEGIFFKIEKASITIQSNICFPINLAAKQECENKLTEFVQRKMKRIKDNMLLSQTIYK
jgi:hypothetical protein